MTVIVRQTFKYRLSPTHAREAMLVETLDRCRELYNAALQERRDAYRMAGKSLTFAHQSAELPAVKDARPEYRDVFSQTLQDVLHRVDRAFQSFFRRVKAGDTSGYPRFQGRNRYASFTYVRHESRSSEWSGVPTRNPTDPGACPTPVPNSYVRHW